VLMRPEFIRHRLARQAVRASKDDAAALRPLAFRRAAERGLFSAP
jgi:hypothetical protein